MKDITIVLLNYFMKEDILKAVDSVMRDISGCPYQVQVVVTDNSENKDGIKEALAERFPRVSYIDCGGNVGFGVGNTIGFKSAEARYYFALNRDTVIPDNSQTIERIIRFMDEHPKIGAIGPKLLNMDGTLQYNCHRFDVASILIKPLKHLNWDTKYAWVKRRTDRLLMKDFDHESTRPVDWVSGAAIVVRAEAVKDAGWFDERYFMYMEDADWCHSLWEHGWPVYYVHAILVKHAHARESAKVPGIMKALFKNKLARIHTASWLKYLWKWRKNHKYYAPLS
jgi:GT2 family glycosyltransferase